MTIESYAPYTMLGPDHELAKLMGHCLAYQVFTF